MKAVLAFLIVAITCPLAMAQEPSPMPIIPSQWVRVEVGRAAKLKIEIVGVPVDHPSLPVEIHPIDLPKGILINGREPDRTLSWLPVGVIEQGDTESSEIEVAAEEGTEVVREKTLAVRVATRPPSGLIVNGLVFISVD